MKNLYSRLVLIFVCFALSGCGTTKDPRFHDPGIWFTQLSPRDRDALILVRDGGEIQNEMLEEFSRLRGRSGMDVLIWAAFHGNKRMMSKLVSAGMNPDQSHLSERSLLCLLIGDGEKDLVYYLISLGAKINDDSSFSKRTPLIEAISIPEHRYGFVAELLRRGADVNQADSAGRTPLMYCINITANYKLALELLRRGANPKAQDYKGRNIADYIVTRSIPDSFMQDRDRFIDELRKYDVYVKFPPLGSR